MENTSLEGHLCYVVCAWECGGAQIRLKHKWARKLRCSYFPLILLKLFTRTESSSSLAFLLLCPLIHSSKALVLHQGHRKRSSDGRLFLHSPICVLLIDFQHWDFFAHFLWSPPPPLISFRADTKEKVVMMKQGGVRFKFGVQLTPVLIHLPIATLEVSGKTQDL